MSENLNPCLTTFDRSRIACGDWQPDARASQHLQSCASCSDQVAAEAAEVRAMAYKPVPAEILALANRQRHKDAGPWQRLWAFMATVAVAAVIAVVGVNRTQAPGVRLKGTSGLALSVMRDGQLVVDDDAVEHHQPLQVGDQVRLHVLNGDTHWINVQVENDGAWDDAFSGAPPRDGWLPFALSMTDPPHVQVRLSTCNGAPAQGLEQAIVAGTCARQTFTLGRSTSP